MSPTTRVGYIGLGQMGAAMASRLTSVGIPVTVFDLDPGAVVALERQGAVAATSNAEVAAACDIVSICVPAERHIHEVLLGDHGLQFGCRAGQTILIHSTVAPSTIMAAQDTAGRWGVSAFDACVAGGTDAARRGEVVILAGGVTEMDAAVVDLLNTYGSMVVDGGAVGAGAALKIGFNVMTYAQFAAASAAFEMVSASGGDPTVLLDAWRHAGQLGKLTESFAALLSIPKEHIKGQFRTSLNGTLAIANKDIELAEELLTDGDTRHALIASLRAAMPAVFGLE